MGRHAALAVRARTRQSPSHCVPQIVLTFVLVLTVYATIDPMRTTTGLAPLAIGFAVGIAHLFALGITGCGINPARSLGPALVLGTAQHRQDLWVFLVGPVVGGLLAAPLYMYLLAEEPFVGGLVGKLRQKPQEIETAKIYPERRESPSPVKRAPEEEGDPEGDEKA